MSRDPITSLGQDSSEPASQAPLPDFDLDTLSVNRDEVATFFHLTIEELMDSNRLSAHHFRGRPPYWCINVSDKVPEQYWTTPRILPTEALDMEDGVDRGKRLEIWGLTAWYLNLFMRRLDLWRSP